VSKNSAGVGRTGTFIAVERLLRYMKYSDSVDIVQTVLGMRDDRCSMVQAEVSDVTSGLFVFVGYGCDCENDSDQSDNIQGLHSPSVHELLFFLLSLSLSLSVPLQYSKIFRLSARYALTYE